MSALRLSKGNGTSSTTVVITKGSNVLGEWSESRGNLLRLSILCLYRTTLER